jgi:hypothetical protein
MVDSAERTADPEKLGVDVGGGGDYNVYAKRQPHLAGLRPRTAAMIP